MGRFRENLRVRRVGFRDGTDEELTAMHAVESVVEAERRPDRTPQPLDSYIAFARSLPSQFDDHTWLVETSDGTPVASGACWSNAAGDARVMECDLYVLRAHRRRGIACELLRAICDETASDGRDLLVWSTFGAVPAGEALSRALGARAARTNRTSELRLGDLDWAMVSRWVGDGPSRAPDYRLELVEGVFPPELRDDAAAFHHIMQTQPRDDLDVGDVVLEAAHVADLDRALVEAGRERWSILVRDPSGACVGGTEVHFEPWEPASVLQQNTGIHPDHRGRGLAKWAKAAMLERIRAERPLVQRVRTGNAFSNEPMLAINDALGFEVIETQTDWQVDVTDLRRALDRR